MTVFILRDSHKVIKINTRTLWYIFNQTGLVSSQGEEETLGIGTQGEKTLWGSSKKVIICLQGKDESNLPTP